MSDSTEATINENLDFKPEVPTVVLGQPVVYISTKGHQKVAFVANTPESVTPGTSLPELSEGQLHLLVTTHAVGGLALRYSVPFEGLVADNSDFQEDGKTVGAWRLV